MSYFTGRVVTVAYVGSDGKRGRIAADVSRSHDAL